MIFIYDFDMQIMRKMLVNLRRMERKMEVINVYSFMIMFYILFVFVFLFVIFIYDLNCV